VTQILFVEQSPAEMGNTAITRVQMEATKSMPVDHAKYTSGGGAAGGSPPPECPMHQKHGEAKSASAVPPHPKMQAASECPVQHDNSDVNPLNMMPPANQQPAADQPFPLPTDRQTSTIPKVTEDGTVQFWQYPSQQMFWNAMLRKGWRWKTEDVSQKDMGDIIRIHRRCIRTFSGHRQAIKDIAWNNRGTNFLSASYDRYIKLWDAETGDVVSRFTTRKMPFCVKFHPDNSKQHLFVAGTSDKKIICVSNLSK